MFLPNKMFVDIYPQDIVDIYQLSPSMTATLGLPVSNVCPFQSTLSPSDLTKRSI